MANSKKIVQAAAGAAGGAALNVEDVFSTYLRSGTGAGTSFSVSNNIDLSGEGGLVWYKRRTGTAIDHVLVDSERGAGYVIESNTTDYSRNRGWFTSFNSDGFSGNGQGNTNDSSNTYASWTFRKAPKFFDVVTYTGTGVARTVSHNLGSVPAMIIVKRTDSATSWNVYHRGLNGGTNPHQYGINLNTTGAEFASSGYWNNTAPTSTEFTVGTSGNANASGGTYVAYLFAHNDGDGDFGPTGDQDIIKCGSHTNSAEVDELVDLGWEPQWILTKKTNVADDWKIFDTMRGLTYDLAGRVLKPNSSNAEADNTASYVRSTGFTLRALAGHTSIYIAIRRGPMAVPESATDVFNIDVRDDTDAPMYKSGFVTDFSLYRDKAAVDDWRAQSRLTGKGTLFPNTTDSESSIYNTTTWDFMNGFHEAGSINTGYLSWMWKRAPNYFDVVAYTGTGSAMTLNHNLGVTPEMIWTKRRDSTGSWLVYHSATGLNKYLSLNSTAAVASAGNYYAVSDTTFGAPFVNSGGTFISYLFASLDGVSKVGSVTIQSGSTTVDCGFSGGPRFVLLKRTDGTSSWNLFDSERGIVAGNDPYLNLNQTAAEITGNDLIDPTSSGFTLTSLWTAGQTWIYYAIA